MATVEKFPIPAKLILARPRGFSEPISLPGFAVYETEDLLGIPRDIEVEV